MFYFKESWYLGGKNPQVYKVDAVMIRLLIDPEVRGA